MRFSIFQSWTVDLEIGHQTTFFSRSRALSGESYPKHNVEWSCRKAGKAKHISRNPSSIRYDLIDAVIDIANISIWNLIFAGSYEAAWCHRRYPPSSSAERYGEAVGTSFRCVWNVDGVSTARNCRPARRFQSLVRHIRDSAVPAALHHTCFILSGEILSCEFWHTKFLWNCRR